MAVQESRTTTETPVLSPDTVLIAAGGLAFAFALLGWLAGHRISLAMTEAVPARALVPLLVGVSGLFLGAGLGLLLGELKRVQETVTTTTTDASRTDVADVADTVKHVVEAFRSFTPARLVLAVGIVLLLATVWLVRPVATEVPATETPATLSPSSPG